jgi:membrane-associated phospholipid phosphatase
MFAVLTILFVGEVLALLMVPAVMFARVYYGFHWIGDTLGGATIGAVIAWSVYTLLSTLV